MRALALVTDAFGGYGGIAQYNRDFLSALAASSSIRDIHVLPRVGVADGELPSKIRQDPPVPARSAYAAQTLSIIAREPFDLVFCGHLYHAPLALLAAGLKQARLICQTHGVEVQHRPPPHQRLSMERADIVLCVSRDTRARVLDWAAIDPERALVLPNTLAGDFTPGDGAVVRGRLGVEGRKVLLSVSRLDTRQRHKGQDRVIAAIPELVARGLDVVYLIAGEGDDAPRLESLARQQGVTDRVRFLGRVPPKDLPDLYRAADLFVLPSTNEGFGIVYLEAMACGTPALGLAAGGAGDALGDGSLGTAVAEPDLAAAIDRILLSGPQDRTALAAATRARFGYDSFVDRVSQLLVL